MSGQFANGDYWVASRSGDPVELVSLTSNQIVRVDDERYLNSQGFFAGNYGNYDASKDILNDLADNPRIYSKNTVLVAATERNQSATSNCGTAALVVNGCIDAYSFITILDEVPPGQGREYLRPPLTGTDRNIQSLNDFDFERIPELDYLSAASDADIEDARRIFTHGTNIFSVTSVSNNQTFSEGGRAFRCGHILCDDYAAGFSKTYYDALYYIFSAKNNSNTTQALLASLLTLGRDMYGMMHQGGCNASNQVHPQGCQYGSGAGQHVGNFIAVAFYASLERDPSKARVLSATTELLNRNQCNQGPQELSQINGHLDDPLFGDCEQFTSQNLNISGYWADMVEASCYDDAPDVCNLIVGQRATRDPYQQVDGSQPRPGGSYMDITLGQQRSMVAVSCVMPDLAATINFPPLYAYVDRISNNGIQTMPDQCAPPSGITDSQSCSDEIWGKRNTDPGTWADSSPSCPGYGVTWGPDPNDLATCIAGAGRFNNTSSNITPLFKSMFEAHFDVMRGGVGVDCSSL